MTDTSGVVAPKYNQIIAGNCKVKLGEFPAKYIDLVVTSPPYDNIRDYKGYSFTGEDFQEIVNPEVRQPIYSSKIGRWQTDLSADEQRLVDVRAGDLLQELGYQK